LICGDHEYNVIFITLLNLDWVCSRIRNKFHLFLVLPFLGSRDAVSQTAV
jgi:hypothetical protein